MMSHSFYIYNKAVQTLYAVSKPVAAAVVFIEGKSNLQHLHCVNLPLRHPPKPTRLILVRTKLPH